MKQLTMLLFLTLSVSAQSGGSYTIEQSAIAGGGSTSGGGSYSITGTTAQSVAGIQSSAGPYGVRGGFWQFFFAPTAATVSVSGRVTDPSGAPIAGVRVFLAGGLGGVRSSLTSSFGYFTFEEIEIGHAYIVSAEHKRHEFVPQTLIVNDNITDLAIVALP